MELDLKHGDLWITIYREEIRIRCNRTRNQKRKAAFLEQSTAQAALREIHIGLRPN